MKNKLYSFFFIAVENKGKKYNINAYKYNFKVILIVIKLEIMIKQKCYWKEHVIGYTILQRFAFIMPRMY